jgi:hypothetical protein
MRLRDIEKLSKPTPSIEEILAKHDVSYSYLMKQLRQGMRVEYEHTFNPAIAKEIALDHLSERPDYYERLAEIEQA